MSDWTRVCQEGSHHLCTGCRNCPCHQVGMPADFRDLVATEIEQRKTS